MLFCCCSKEVGNNLVSHRLEYFKIGFAKFYPFSGRNPPFHGEFLHIFFGFPNNFSCWKSYLFVYLFVTDFSSHLLVTSFSYDETDFHFVITLFGLFSNPIATQSDFLCILVYFHQHFSANWDFPFFSTHAKRKDFDSKNFWINSPITSFLPY